MTQCMYLLLIQFHMSFTEAYFSHFLLVLKSFSYTVWVRQCPVEQGYTGIILFVIVFYRWL